MGRFARSGPFSSLHHERISAMKHTKLPPAPWTYAVQYLSAERKATTGYFIIDDANGDYIGKIEGEALARIVTATPEMLAALEFIATDIQECVRARHVWLKKARAAIAKAEGGAP
jgi:hypothetical protein